jgi:hypothetical protein
MKALTILIPIVLCLAAPVGAAEPAGTPPTNAPGKLQATPGVPLSVAVFDFEAREEGVRDMGSKLAALISVHLSTEADLVLVERAELEKALGEQELGLSGTVSSETAAKVGHLTGAKVLVTGKLFKADRELMAVAKVIGTETSRVYGELAKGPATTSLDDLAAQLARKIAASIVSKADTLVARPLTREDRVVALKNKLGASKLPTVSVSIPEQHYGAPAVDPAAQTELGLILQQCGFTLVDDKSDAKADVEVSGEAFSAFGLRRGNLVSCKARIELKARSRKNGTVLTVDRETSVAVDIAEQTAAKTALQNAAAELASRLIPRLARVPGVASNE